MEFILKLFNLSEFAYFNEIIFFTYSIFVSIVSLIALRLGKEALITLVALYAILLNLLVLKEINLFGLTATACDALTVGITLSINLIQEHFDYKTAKKAVWISVFCSIVYLIITQLHLLYISSILDTNSINYIALLTPAPRLIIASLVVYAIVQQIDCRLYKFFSDKFNKQNFLLRNYSSIAITQLLDTVLFSFLGLYKLNSAFSSLNAIIDIIIISYIIKLIAIAISTPISLFSKKFITYP